MQLFQLFLRYGIKIPPKNPLYSITKYMLNNNSKTKKKSRIEEYYSDIYDVYLVVANENVTLEQLRKRYKHPDGEELKEEILDGSATTCSAVNRKTDASVLIVKYNRLPHNKTLNKKTTLVNICSHEATHVALDIYEMLGQNICFCTPEPFCYLQAWATECIYKTLTK